MTQSRNRCIIRRIELQMYRARIDSVNHPPIYDSANRRLLGESRLWRICRRAKWARRRISESTGRRMGGSENLWARVSTDGLRIDPVGELIKESSDDAINPPIIAMANESIGAYINDPGVESIYEATILSIDASMNRHAL